MDISLIKRIYLSTITYLCILLSHSIKFFRNSPASLFAATHIATYILYGYTSINTYMNIYIREYTCMCASLLKITFI